MEMWDLGVVGKLHTVAPRFVSSVGPIQFRPPQPRWPAGKGTPLDIAVVPSRGASDMLRIALSAVDKENGSYGDAA
jgi:hypothetical protein